MPCLASVGCIMLWWRLAYATRERKRICPIYPHAGNLRFVLTQYFHSCLLLHASWCTRIHACIHALTDIVYSISSMRKLPEFDSVSPWKTQTNRTDDYGRLGKGLPPEVWDIKPSSNFRPSFSFKARSRTCVRIKHGITSNRPSI